MKRVLIVDDDRRMRRTLQILVERMGLESVAAADAGEAREQLHIARFDLVLTDLKMPETSGIDLLAEIRAEQPTLPVVLITAYGTIQNAIEAMRQGASDFILKPFDNDGLERVIRKALELERVRSENAFLKQQVGESWAAEDMFLALPSMGAIADLIARVAPSASPVLVTGETGTGKELVARCHPRRRARGATAFVPLNCAALPGELLEASSSATRAARSPAPTATGRASSRWPTAARCSSTRSATCRWRCRRSCCACSRTARSSRSASNERVRRRRAHRLGDQPDPARRRSPPSGSAATSTTG